MNLSVKMGVAAALSLHLAVTTAAFADPGGIRGQVYIEQIQGASTAPSGYRPRSVLETGDTVPQQGLVNQIVSIGNRLPVGTTVYQSGSRNIASSSVEGRLNALGQFQIGTNHESYMDVSGNNNRLTSLQKGRSAFSDIDVIGSNKTIYHLQIGPTPRLKELPFSNNRPEDYLIIDNGRQAYIKKLN